MLTQDISLAVQPRYTRHALYNVRCMQCTMAKIHESIFTQINQHQLFVELASTCYSTEYMPDVMDGSTHWKIQNLSVIKVVMYYTVCTT